MTARARSRWLRQPALTALRTDLAAVLRRNGGVMTGDDLADTVLVLRGFTRDGDERRRRANAVVRAAVEAETARDAPRFAVYRRPQGPSSLPRTLGRRRRRQLPARRPYLALERH